MTVNKTSCTTFMREREREREIQNPMLSKVSFASELGNKKTHYMLWKEGVAENWNHIFFFFVCLRGNKETLKWLFYLYQVRVSMSTPYWLYFKAKVVCIVDLTKWSIKARANKSYPLTFFLMILLIWWPPTYTMPSCMWSLIHGDTMNNMRGPTEYT